MDLYQVCSNGGPAAGGLGFKKEIYLKNLLQSCLVQGLEIWFIALPGGPLPSLLKPRFQGPRWPRARGSSVRTTEKHKNIFKNLLCQNHMAQMFEIWYVALPSGPLPSLFRYRSQGPRWPLARGPRFKPKKFIEKYSKIFFRTTWLRCLKFGM